MTTPTKPNKETTTTGNLTGQTRNVYEAVKAEFAKYGLSSLADEIESYIKQGITDAATIRTLLENTKEYKERFKGNEARRKQNKAVLSPAEYVAMETEYRNQFQRYGLPPGLFDEPSEMADYIGKDISPNEMRSRLEIARQMVASNADTYRAWFDQGLTEGDAIAAVLDPVRAVPKLEQKARDMKFGQLSREQARRAEELADYGVTADEARRGYQAIGQFQERTNTLAAIYGDDEYTMTDAEDEVFLGSADAANRRRTIYSKEQANFGGRTLADSRSLKGGSY